MLVVLNNKRMNIPRSESPEEVDFWGVDSAEKDFFDLALYNFG